MTFRADEIQKLIADIDNLLSNSSKRLPRLLPGQAQEGKEVLQRVREFLVQLVESEELVATTPEGSTVQPLSSLLTRFIEQGHKQTESASYQPENKQDLFETQQLKSEFSALLQPLQAELSELLQERAALVQEIRQLEQKRLQNYSLTQQLATQEQIISEFLQVLMSRLTTTLATQLPQNPVIEGESPNSAAVSPATPVLESAQRMERLANLVRELDQHLLSLDGTVNVVFAALERNINTYHQSLSESLAKMHSQGLQGEQLMANLLHNLTQYSQLSAANIQPLSAEVNQEIAASTPISEIDTQEIDSLSEVAAQEAEINTEDLDTVLSQLNIDESLPVENGSVLPSVSIESPAGTASDEVDELYASLFGKTESNLQEAIAQNTPAPEDAIPSLLENADLAIAPESLELSITNSDVEDEPATTSQAWELSEDFTDSLLELESTLDQSDAPDSLLKSTLEPSDFTDSLLESTLDQSDAPDSFLESTLEQSDTWDVLLTPEETPATTEVTAADLDDQPDGADTITVLTDLLVDVSSDQQLLELPSWANSPEMITADLSPVSPPVAITKEKQNLLPDNYIPASPQENLLSLEDSTASAVPEIFLDEAQLQQLDQDLANFDRQSLDSSADLHDYQHLLSLSQNSLATTEAPVENLVENLSASVDLSQETEKKKEDTSSQKESSLPGSGDGLTNTQGTGDLLNAVWYLGLDLGTTGISAALLNRSTAVVYPLYWSAETQPGVSAFDQSFRLPAEVYLPTAAPPSEAENSLEQISPALAEDQVADQSVPRLYSAQLKPYLQVAIPYKSDRQKWEPVLKLNEFSAGPLIWVVRSLSKLLSTLKSVPTSTTPALIAHAVGLEAEVFSEIINKISGVICTCPSSWSEQYRFNVREAIISSQLVAHPQQVFFIEEAIASLLPEIKGANGESVQVNSLQGLSPLKASEYPLLGNTLVINIGATATEMALVDLPTNWRQLTHKDFMLHSFNYAGKGMEQDVICQLLLPPKSRQPRPATPDNTDSNHNSWHWQPSIPGLDQIQWESLQVEGLELPKVGEPDLPVRMRLQQRLESSLLGQALLDASVVLKLILQHQESFTLDLADQRWILQRRDLESQVFVPFVRRLNRELNKLLVARGIPTEAINQAILTGGVASIGTVSRWLRQKLPNAKIIQDLYLNENGAPNCSRVAYGLAALPLHPQVLDVPRQQYTDYFLFTELLNLLPDRSLSFGEVLQLFEERGVNTRACQQRLLAFLEGELPAGLIPVPLDSVWLTKHSQTNPDYQAIASAPLFAKLGNLTYRPHEQQVLFLRSYLQAIKASTLQSLEEPYTVNFVLEVNS
ncbi:MAG TPA: hypothetical protein VK203_16060 [Nostocaceae cyanobacterium]|nr:hypothetical protein [Nostocaceae cyanobacterium]